MFSVGMIIVPWYLDTCRYVQTTVHYIVWYQTPTRYYEKYALYIAFEGKLPKENSGTGERFDDYDEESEMEEVNATIE
jgi:hypothetical protein